MQKKLSSLLQSFSFQCVAADGKTPFDDSLIGATPVENLVFDSRKVTSGSLYFALPGTHVNGNRFIASAIDKGANVIIFQGDIDHDDAVEIAKAVVRRELNGVALEDKKINDVTLPVFLKVEDARLAMAPVSDAFYGSPSKKMVIIGVTGTEGKSSTVSFLWQLLRLAGKKCGFISTVQYSLGGEALPNPDHATTPEAPIIQHHLNEMVENGCEYAVIESSSHGLSKKLGRLNNVLFDAGIFMNVTLEHLEFHKTFDQYRSDKANLFRALDEHNHEKTILGVKRTVPGFGVVNLEDESASYFINATQHKVMGFTSKGEAGRAASCEIKLPEIPSGIEYVEAGNLISNATGISFTMKDTDEKQSYNVKAELPGAFNAYNLMATLLTVSQLTGISLSELIPLTSKIKPIQGRMTRIDIGQNFEVIVDYAHTPSSFEVVFPPVRNRAKGKIFALFGSGGERDLTKRPLQGEIAGRYCDYVILTDEDPRGEDSRELLEMIAAGARKAGKTDGKDLFIIPDRPTAIRRAFAMAKENDIVLLLGKGHENSIIYKDKTIPYDEIAEAKIALAELSDRQ